MKNATQNALPLQQPVIRTMDNGITVILEPLPHLRTVTMGVWIQTGSANESPSQGGMSHFLEHLFFKGTSSRSPHDLMKAIESKGGHLNAFTARDYTCLYAKTLDNHADTAIEILGDILCDSQFFDFEKERNVILEEIASNDDVPEDRVHELFTEDLFPDHGLGRPITGTLESVSALTLEDVQSYYTHWYHPGNTIISVVGRFDEEALFQQISKAFAALPTKGSAVGAAYDAPAFGAGVRTVHRDIAQSHLCFGFPGPASTDPGRYTYDILGNLLGGGSTSRLFERIREDEGLAYSIYTFQASYFHAGYLGVYGAIAPENLEKTVELSFEELRDVRDNGLRPEELETSREQIKGGVLMALESPFNRTSRHARSFIYRGRILTIDEIIAAFDAVTEEDVQALARKLLTPEHCALVVLGPESGPVIKEVPL